MGDTLTRRRRPVGAYGRLFGHTYPRNRKQVYSGRLLGSRRQASSRIDPAWDVSPSHRSEPLHVRPYVPDLGLPDKADGLGLLGRIAVRVLPIPTSITAIPRPTDEIALPNMKRQAWPWPVGSAVPRPNDVSPI